jgi:hypothetical protein
MAKEIAQLVNSRQGFEQPRRLCAKARVAELTVSARVAAFHGYGV